MQKKFHPNLDCDHETHTAITDVHAQRSLVNFHTQIADETEREDDEEKLE